VHCLVVISDLAQGPQLRLTRFSCNNSLLYGGYRAAAPIARASRPCEALDQVPLNPGVLGVDSIALRTAPIHISCYVGLVSVLVLKVSQRRLNAGSQ
jgi:hypothetical protein